ncbi:hypothetical protein ABPG74_021340 [Tetrahymena malaccensis]
MNNQVKSVVSNFIKCVQQQQPQSKIDEILDKNSPNFFKSLSQDVDQSEETFKDESISSQLFNIFQSQFIQQNQTWIGFTFDLILIAYNNKKRVYMQLFVKSLIPVLMSIYIIKYYEEFSLKEKSQEGQKIDINLFAGLLIKIYNFEIENAKKLNQAQDLNSFKELTSFHDKYQKTLQETSEQQQQLKEIQYNEITAINPQQHLILCEVLIRIFCQDLNYYFSYVIPTYLRMIFVVTGVPLNVLDLKPDTQIQNFKINQAQIFIVRITPPAIQDIISSIYNILISHKNLSKQANQCLDLLLQKTSNESQFKLADMCQAVIELTRDEYEDIYDI